ncbi:MAG: TonB-dependent receptor [Rhodospirillaceae bacterium]
MTKSKSLRSKLALRSSVFALSGLVFAAPEAFAQQVAVEEIVVTARKRAESLQDVPLSITAFSADMIEKSGIRSIGDVAKLTSSLVFETSFVPQDTRPVIRGLSATRGRQPIGVLLDGIDISSESLLTGGGGIGMNLRLVDAERIEVVKGPQSALYGRVAFGGAINYISKKPGDEFEGRLFADVGDHGQAELTGSISGPVSDTVGVRLNATYAQHDGFYRNAISGANIGDYESYGAALSASFQASENFTVDARLSYSKDEAGPAAQYFLGAANGGTTLIDLPASAQPLIDAGVLPAQTRYTLGDFEPVQKDLITLSLDPRTGEDYEGSDVDALYASLIMEYDFGNVKLNSWTGVSDVDGFYRVDTDFYAEPNAPVLFPTPGGFAEPLPNTFESSASTSVRQINQEVRIGDLESDGFRWAVGGLYWDENYVQTDRNLITVVVGLPGVSSAALNTRLAMPSPERPTRRDTEHWSVYGIFEYDISDKLVGSVEARYSDESFSYVWPNGGAAVSVFGPPAGAGAFTTFTASDSDNFFAPKFTLEYQATDDALLYASVSKGVKPGGFSTVAAPRIENARYTAETLWNYEVGTKTSWADGRFIANGSVFLMKYTDKQFQQQIPDDTSPNGLTGRTANAADSEVRGFEVDFAAAPAEGVSLNLGYTFLDTEYTDFSLFSTTPLAIASAGNCTPTTLNGNPGCQLDFSGKRIERSPKHALNLSAGYTVPISDDLDLFGVIDAQYQGRRGNDTAEASFYPSYWNVDARFGVENDVWSLFAYGTNILGDDTVRGGTGFGDFTAFGNIGFALNAPPKTQLGVRASYSW